MIFVLGNRGRLGKAIISACTDEVIAVDRNSCQDWWQTGSEDKVSEFFKSRIDGSDSVVFVATGTLDPKLSEEEHLRVNYLLPRHLIEGTAKLGLRVVTFGTVMEGLIRDQNPYIHSKTMLGDYIAGFPVTENRPLHLRLHTLYGPGKPSPFMFLGQIYHALLNQTVFEMSPGNQVREYHHVEDEVQSIRVLAEAQIDGVVDLSHGMPVKLKEIATYVFEAFNMEHLLRIGALPEPKDENYETVFQRPELLQNIRYRDTLPAIVNCLKRELEKSS